MSSPMEQELSSSQRSPRILALSIASTLIIFSGLSLSSLGKIEQLEDFDTRAIDFFIPPPPPPKSQQTVVETPPQTNFEFDISLESSETILSYKKIDAVIDSSPNIHDSMDISISSFLKQNISTNLDTPVYTRTQLDERPSGWQFTMPSIPSKYARKHSRMVFQVMCLIDERGKVIRAHAIESPSPELANLIEASMLRSRYSQPGKKNGKRVKCWIRRKLTIKPPSSKSPFSI